MSGHPNTRNSPATLPDWAGSGAPPGGGASEQTEGIQITRFCQERRYGLRSRLDLFRKLCLLVHQARLQGACPHRLAPSNILVALRRGKPVLILVRTEAASTNHDELHGETVDAHSGMVPDSLGYSSPEEVTRRGPKADARSDVYRLGILLYELVTDQPPFDPQRLQTSRPRKRRRIIRTERPPSPSKRLARSRSQSDSPQSRPSHLPLSSVQGPLDQIVMKAIGKRRAGRYPTAKALATDLQYHLAGEPIDAVARQEAGRHRSVLALAATIAFALGAVTIIGRWEAAVDEQILLASDRARLQAEIAYANTPRQPAPAKTPSPEIARSYEGPLDRQAPRGIKTITFKVPGDRPDEICVIPRHLSFARYRGKGGAKDKADERQLASYDYYKTGLAGSGVIGISPKRTSTSAAVNLYRLPEGTTRPERLTASFCRSVEKAGKRVAKFKQTDNKFTTTSTASILGYYHVSRALGDICEIKPAVLRTMDIQQHKKVVRLASDLGARGTVAKSWALFNRYYANPRRSAVARDLFTSDFTQIYGALIENTTGEEGYSEWLRAGTNLSRTTAFRQMADPRPAASIVGSRRFSQRNVQTLVAMRDMSELILLDYLLAQSDRLSGGNISAYRFAYYLDGEEVKSSKASKASDLPPETTKVIVRKLTIKDTDAGLLNSNVFERKGYLPRIRHMHPRTYRSLQTFARKWDEDPSVKAFFRRECTFNSTQLARFEKYLRHAATTLRQLQEDGALHLDLDLDDYFKDVESLADSPNLVASVGRWDRGAANRRSDIVGVQRLLATAAQRWQAPELDPKGIDGRIARPPRKSNTIAAIESFERICQLKVDGVIEPGSQAWLALLAAVGRDPANRDAREEATWTNTPPRTITRIDK